MNRLLPQLSVLVGLVLLLVQLGGGADVAHAVATAAVTAFVTHGVLLAGWAFARRTAPPPPPAPVADEEPSA